MRLAQTALAILHSKPTQRGWELFEEGLFNDSKIWGWRCTSCRLCMVITFGFLPGLYGEEFLLLLFGISNGELVLQEGRQHIE